MPLSQQQLDTAFATLERCAIAGERCPVNSREGHRGLPSNATNMLADTGRIKVEVYALNWRVVEIMVGPNKGKRTAAPQYGSGQPYIIKFAGKTLRPTEQEPRPALVAPTPRAAATSRRYHSNFEPT